MADESIADAPEPRAAADEPAAEELSAEEAASNEEEADPFPRSNRTAYGTVVWGGEIAVDSLRPQCGDCCGFCKFLFLCPDFISACVACEASDGEEDDGAHCRNKALAGCLKCLTGS